MKKTDTIKTNPSIPTVQFWINGKAEISNDQNRHGNVTNAATGEILRKVPFADSETVNDAVQAASTAFKTWRATTPVRRARILMRFRDLLAQHSTEFSALITQEHGKTLLDAEGSLQRGLEVVEFAIGVPHLLKGEHAEDVGTAVDCHTVKQPLGVCAGITPSNFPIMVPLWMVPVAIACGNTFVLKPSEKDPSASVKLAKLFTEAGLPEGVLNVVHGDKECVDALLVHPDVRAVSFVGSTPVARYIYETASHHGKRVQALGGAKNHAIVLPDAELEATTDAIIGAAYGSAGERCMAISAVVAVGEIGDRLVDTLKDKATRLKVGPGDAKGVEMGPLITKAHQNKVKGYVDIGEEEGATLVLDGRAMKIAGYENGYFLGPTLFDHVRPDMTIYKDEIFGPVLVILRCETFTEAIDIVNRNAYGNGAAVFTRSGATARRFENEVQVGMVGINIPIPIPMAFFSFGGWKNSLFGDLHVHGLEGVKFYTRTKVVTTHWPEN